MSGMPGNQIEKALGAGLAELKQVGGPKLRRQHSLSNSAIPQRRPMAREAIRG
jgi:hypothetical protein